MLEGLVVAAALCAFFVYIWRTSDQSKLGRLVRGTKRWTVATLPEAMIGRIDGIAKGRGRTVEAPVSGRPCLVYCVHVIQHTYNPKKDDEELGLEVGGVEFDLEDASGVAIVDPDVARSALPLEQLELPAPAERSAVQGAFMERYVHATTGIIGPMRLFEAIVVDGDPIAVVGFGERGEKLRMHSSPHFPLVIAKRTTRR